MEVTRSLFNEWLQLPDAAGQIAVANVCTKVSKRLFDCSSSPRLGQMPSISCSSPFFLFLQGMNLADVEAIDIVVDNALSHFRLSQSLDRDIDAPPRMPRRESLPAFDTAQEIEKEKSKLSKLWLSAPLNHSRWDCSCSSPQHSWTAGSRKSHSNGDSAPVMMRRTQDSVSTEQGYRY